MMSVVAGIVVVTLAFTISMYNKLVMRRNQVSSVEASVDVQLSVVMIYCQTLLPQQRNICRMSVVCLSVS